MGRVRELSLPGRTIIWKSATVKTNIRWEWDLSSPKPGHPTEHPHLNPPGPQNQDACTSDSSRLCSFVPPRLPQKTVLDISSGAKQNIKPIINRTNMNQHFASTLSAIYQRRLGRSSLAVVGRRERRHLFLIHLRGVRNLSAAWPIGSASPSIRSQRSGR